MYLLILERGKVRGGRGRETLMWERDIHQVPLAHALNGNWTWNPAMCPDQESNLWLFSLWNDAPANWATPARAPFLLFDLWGVRGRVFVPSLRCNSVNGYLGGRTLKIFWKLTFVFFYPVFQLNGELSLLLESKKCLQDWDPAFIFSIVVLGNFNFERVCCLFFTSSPSWNLS